MKKLFKRKKKSASEVGSLASGRSASGYEVPSKKDLPKLHNAAREGDLTKLKALLKKGDVNQLDKDNRTPLHIACAFGKIDAVRMIVNHPHCQLNLCDNDRNSPLMKCVQCQYHNCLDILLRKRADVSLSDTNGNTALHLAASIPSKELCYLLLDYSADVHAKNKDGSTPLHLVASASESEEIVAALLDDGAHINAKDACGKTPLMLAASRGNLENVKLLLSKDADALIRENRGWTADDYASMSGYHPVSHIIVEHTMKHKRPKETAQSSSQPLPKSSSKLGYSAGGGLSDLSDLSQDEELSKISDGKESEESVKAYVPTALLPPKPKVNVAQFLKQREQMKKNPPVQLDGKDTKEVPGSSTPQKNKSPQISEVSGDSDTDSGSGDLDHSLDENKIQSRVYSSNSGKGGHVSPSKPPLPVNKSPGSNTSSPALLARNQPPEIQDNASDSPWDSEEEEESDKEERPPIATKPTSSPGRFVQPNKNIMAELGLNEEDLHHIYDNPSEESVDFSSHTQFSMEQPATTAVASEPDKKTPKLDESDDEEASSKSSSSWDDEKSSENQSNRLTKVTGAGDYLAGSSMIKFDDEISEEVVSESTPVQDEVQPQLTQHGGQINAEHDQEQDSDSSSWDSEGIVENPIAVKSQVSPFKASAVVAINSRDKPDDAESVNDDDDDLTESESSWEIENRQKRNGIGAKVTDASKKYPLQQHDKKDNEAEKESPVTDVINSDDEEARKLSQPQKKILSHIATEAADIVKKKQETLERQKVARPNDEQISSTQDREVLETALRQALDESANLSESDSSELDNSYMGNAEVGKKQKNGDAKPSSIPVPTRGFTIASQRKMATLNGTGEAHKHVNGMDVNNWTGTETDTDADDEPAQEIPSSLIASSLSEHLLRSGERGALEREAAKEKQRAFNAIEKLDYANRDIQQLKDKINEYKRSEKDWSQRSDEQEANIRKLNFEQTHLKEQLSSIELELKLSRSRVNRMEEQLGVEESSRRKQEVTIRELRTELKNSDQTLKKLEAERDRLRHELSNEEQRVALHDHMAKEKEKIGREIENERSHDSRHIEALNLLMREKDQELLHAKAERDAFKESCERYKEEIKRFSANGDDQQTLMGKLNEELNDDVHELTRKLSASQEALNQAALQYTMQFSHLKQANDTLTEQIKKERSEKDNILRDLEVLNDQQRTLKRNVEDLESYKRRHEDITSSLEKEIRDLKEKKEEAERKLHSAEVADNLTQQEANSLRTSLTHKESTLTQMMRDREEARESLRRKESELNESQRENAKLSGRVEMLQADVAQQDSERLRLRRELEDARNFGNSTLTSQQGKLSEIVTGHQNERVELEKTNAQLGQQVAHLRDEIKRINEEKMKREEEVALAQQDRIETHKRLSFTESSMAQLSESQRQLQEDKQRIQSELEASRARCSSLEDRAEEANKLVSTLRSELEAERTECNSARRDMQTLKLDSSQYRDGQSRLEVRLKEAELANVRLQSELSSITSREQQVKDEQDLIARSRIQLEELVARLQDEKAFAVEKSRTDSNRCQTLQAEAEGHKKMWESEVKARSKLSVEFAKAGKERKDAVKLMEKYKRKLTRTSEESRSYQTKYENQRKQRSQLSDRLDYYSKMAAESKVPTESSETECKDRLSSMSELFENERSLLGETINYLEAQVSNLSQRLSEESEIGKSVEEESDISRKSTRHETDSSMTEVERERDQLRDEVKKYREKNVKQSDQSRVNAIANAEVNAKLNQVNLWLEERASAQEVLERLRLESEEKRVAEANRRADALQQERDLLRQRLSGQLNNSDQERERDRHQTMKENIELQQQLQRTKTELDEHKAKWAYERKKYQSLHASALGGSIAGHVGSGLRSTSPSPFHASPPFQLNSRAKSSGDIVMSSTPRRDLSVPILANLRNKLDASIALKLAGARSPHSASPGSDLTSSSQRRLDEGGNRTAPSDYLGIP